VALARGPQIAHPLRIAARGDEVANAVDGQRVHGDLARRAARAAADDEHAGAAGAEAEADGGAHGGVHDGASGETGAGVGGHGGAPGEDA